MLRDRPAALPAGTRPGAGVALVELRAVGLGQPDDVPGELDRRALQAQADAEERQPGLAGEPDGVDLPLDAALVEPAGHEQPVHARQRACAAPSAASFSESIRTTRTFAWWAMPAWSSDS